MAKGRMLNKSICSSAQVHALPDWACRCMATWIVAHLDKNGVFYGDAAMVRSQVFPLEDIPLATVEEYLVSMEQALDEDGQPLIVRFRARSRLWQFWPGFDRNQPGLRKEKERTDYAEPPEEWRQADVQKAGTFPPTDGLVTESGRNGDGKGPSEHNRTEPNGITEQEQEENTTEEGAGAPVDVAAHSRAVSCLLGATVGSAMSTVLADEWPLERIELVVGTARATGKGAGWIVDALRGEWDLTASPPQRKGGNGNGRKASAHLCKTCHQSPCMCDDWKRFE